MLELDKIYNMDCLDGMKQLDDNSIDMILCDLPYGVTQCKWDKPLPLNELWNEYKRIINNGIIVFTAVQPYATDLINSNRNWFKYEWIWNKIIPSDSFNSNIKPLKQHENILVFYEQNKFNPVLVKGKRHRNIISSGGGNYGKAKGRKNRKQYYTNLWKPRSILEIKKDIVDRLHPTQKPLELFEYLIKTYSNENDLVLDNCMGSGTTAVACKKLNRHFIGFEIDENYYNISLKRLLNVPERLEKWIDS